MSVKNLLAIAPLSMLVACGWVDSTGREANSAPVTQISFADGQQTQNSVLNELASLTLSVTSSDADGSINTLKWLPDPVEQGALEQCRDVPDFDISIAVDSLAEACASDAAACRVDITEADPAADTDEFRFTAPKLKAPVGVTFQLNATDNEGGVGTQRSTFCLVAINEAPDVNDDRFTVLEGNTLTVTAAQVNLLTNDKVHEHVSNRQLQVLSGPARLPTLASAFSLANDGGFSYVSSLLVDRNAEFVDDTFIYTVTDGSNNPTTGTATVRVLAKNDPPEQLAPVPVQQFVAGVAINSDLSEFFFDPEGASLTFALTSGSLPPSGGLALTSAGLLTGVTQLIDVGSYPIQLVASDGTVSIAAEITIVIADNLPVEATAIAAQASEVGVPFTIDVSASFSDPEQQALSYSLDTTYTDATLVMDTDTGILTGVFADIGQYTIDVSANDGTTDPSSIRFVVVVTTDNVGPTFLGTIANQTISLGEVIAPIRGAFNDPNADELTYSIVGELPAGLTMSAAGVISGRPTVAGIFNGLRIVATDPLGLFARSNVFVIKVSGVPGPPANRSPIYTAGTVFNQAIPLGIVITPITPTFSDPDNDVLSYAIIGNLPLGVSIDSATGVVSGLPQVLGWDRNLRVLATDPSGASATSGVFWIQVE